MMDTRLTEAWARSHPQAQIGILQSGPFDNRRPSAALEGFKTELVMRLRDEFGHLSRAQLREIPVLAAYKRYYRRFNKTYHVLLQLESILRKGRSLPTVTPLVDVAFASELESFLLTASHDRERLLPPVEVDVATGEEIYVGLKKNDLQPKPGDMLMRDAAGVVCSVMYGQDRRTSISPATQSVVYVTYCPSGTERAMLQEHHRILEENVRRVNPSAAAHSFIHSASELV